MSIQVATSSYARWTLLAALTVSPAVTTSQDQVRVRGGPFPRQITLFDRQGTARALGQPGNYFVATEMGGFSLALSPDARRLAVLRPAPDTPARHIWVIDLATGADTQVTSDPAGENVPVWSPDGGQIAFVSRRQGHTGLYRKMVDGTGPEELLYQDPIVAQTILTDWSPDGRFLAFDSGGVLYVLPLTGNRKPIELLREEYEAYGGRFSGDSRFLSYSSDESGRNEVYVRAFDPALGRFASSGSKWRISNQGPRVQPQESCYTEARFCMGPVYWRLDDKEVYFVTPGGAVMVVDVTTTPAFTAGPPRPLMRLPSRDGSISRNGRMIAFPMPIAPDRKVIAVAPEILRTYTGTYAFEGSDSQLIVSLDDRQLTAEPVFFGGDKGEKFALLAETESYFFRRTSDFDGDFEFVKDDKGVVTHLLNYMGTRSRKALRK